MKPKHIHFIVNPASGKQEPILSYINQVMETHQIKWDISVTRKDVKVSELVRKAFGKTDLIAVYGGDGCVTEVAAALQGGKIPMAIIPGGTANVMARELGIPLDTKEALESLFASKIVKIDMGMVNDMPFLLRVNLGIMADMVTAADRKLKGDIGQLAYGVTAIQTTAKAKAISYGLEIDGKKIATEGVSMTITNSGSLGVGNFALQPGISITDGKLDVVLLKENDISSLLKVAGSTLLGHKSDVLEHWSGKKITVNMSKKQSFICDDRQENAKQLKIEAIPAALRILIPKQTNK